MRFIATALLLCSLAVVHVSGNHPFPPLVGPVPPPFPQPLPQPFPQPLPIAQPVQQPVERWDEVNKIGNVAVSTAKDLVKRVLDLDFGKYFLYMDLALGAKFAPFLNRHLKYRYYFRIKTKGKDSKLYKCKAQIKWPKDAKKPSFDPLPPGEDFNNCTEATS
ncbi:hypothetical protein ACF0H5_023972 [Mactra antiquata]